MRVYNRVLSAAEVQALYTYDGRSSITCTDPDGREGDMLYNGDFNVLQWCGAGKWHAAGPVPGAGVAGCSDPGGVAGVLVFNSSYNVMQYCDGTYWRAIGK